MQTLLKKIFTRSINCFFLVYSIPLILLAQEGSQKFSLKPYFTVLDTVDKDGKDPYIRAKWLDTVILLRIPQSAVQQKLNMDKLRPFYEKRGEVMDTQMHKDWLLVGAQNCHSYALEAYLASKDIQDNQLFTPTTSLFNWEMAKVLDVSFKRIQRLTPKVLQKSQVILPQKTLLVFKDKNDSPIHSVFYNQGFQSKNGVFKPYTFKTIKPLLKAYFDTVWIDQFEVDTAQLVNYKKTSHE